MAKTKPTSTNSTKSTKKKASARVRERVEKLLHAVPIFTEDGEVGYLIAMKSVPKDMLSTLDDAFPEDPNGDSWSHEKGAGIFVPQDLHEGILDTIEEVYFGRVAWCEDCMNGIPCDDVHVDFDAEGFIPRNPKLTTPDTQFSMSDVKSWIRGRLDEWKQYKQVADDVFDIMQEVYNTVRAERLSKGAGAAASASAARMTHMQAAEILGVEWPCDEATLKAAFRRAAINAHPDRGGSEALMKKVLAAREVLVGM